MKILMIAPTPFFADRGCHVRIYEEIKALQKMGHKITLVTYNIGQNMSGIKVIRIPNLFFWYKKLEAGPSWWKPFLDLLLVIKSIQVYRKSDYDIIHAHLHEGALVGYITKFSKLKKVPLVFDFQGSLTGELMAHHFIREHKYLYGFFRFMEKIINKMADIIITSSIGSYNELVNEFKIDVNNVVYIQDGVGEGFYKTVAKSKINHLKKQLKIDIDKLVIIYIGVLSQYQGVDIILASARKIVKSNKKVHFVIGGYPNIDSYKQIAIKMGIAEYVSFPGRIPYLESLSYLAMGDVAVSPKISKTEANGKLFYYAAAGKPSVVFDSVVNREILGELGIYAKFNDENDFSEKLINTIKNINKLEPLSKKLRNRALNEFSWRKSALDIVKIYEKLLSE